MCEVPLKKWESMSGFVEGVAETAVYDYDDMHKNLLDDAVALAKLWFGVPLHSARVLVENPVASQTQTLIYGRDKKKRSTGESGYEAQAPQERGCLPRWTSGWTAGPG